MTLIEYLKREKLAHFPILQHHLGHIVSAKFKEIHKSAPPKISVGIVKLCDYHPDFLASVKEDILSESIALRNKLRAKKLPDTPPPPDPPAPIEKPSRKRKPIKKPAFSARVNNSN